MKSLILLLIAILLAVSSVRGRAASSRWHTVRGRVVDRVGRPVTKATVFLKDVEGHRLRMKQTDAAGSFSFGLVNLSIRREIYAEQNGSVSLKVPVEESRAHDTIVTLTLQDKAAKVSQE